MIPLSLGDVVFSDRELLFLDKLSKDIENVFKRKLLRINVCPCRDDETKAYGLYFIFDLRT